MSGENKSGETQISNFWKGIGIGLVVGLTFSVIIFSLGFYYNLELLKI